MNYDVLVRQFLDRSLPKDQWTHEAHLIVGLWHVLHYGAETALGHLRTRILAYNAACGVANTDISGYHETITQFYVQLIAAFVAKRPQESDDWSHLAAELITTHRDRDLVFRYWTPERLFSVAARQQWQTPDRLPLEL